MNQLKELLTLFSAITNLFFSFVVFVNLATVSEITLGLQALHNLPCFTERCPLTNVLEPWLSSEANSAFPYARYYSYFIPYVRAGHDQFLRYLSVAELLWWLRGQSMGIIAFFCVFTFSSNFTFRIKGFCSATFLFHLGRYCLLAANVLKRDRIYKEYVSLSSLSKCIELDTIYFNDLWPPKHL